MRKRLVSIGITTPRSIGGSAGRRRRARRHVEVTHRERLIVSGGVVPEVGGAEQVSSHRVAASVVERAGLRVGAARHRGAHPEGNETLAQWIAVSSDEQ